MGPDEGLPRIRQREHSGIESISLMRCPEGRIGSPREDPDDDAAMHLILKKERLKDVRYQEFRGVALDCVERLKLQSRVTSFFAANRCVYFFRCVFHAAVFFCPIS